MGRPTKYNARYKADIIGLYAEGYSLDRIAELCGISRMTLHHWIKKYELREEMDARRSGLAKECIEVGLRKLAKGAKEENRVEKFVFYRKATRLEIQEDGTEEEVEYMQPVEATRKIKVHIPESKAIEILARKYHKELDPKSEERDFTEKLLESFTMRELQEAKANNPIDQAAIEVEGFEVIEEDDTDSQE